MLDTLDSYVGFLRSTLGMSGSPLYAMTQATEQQLVALQAQYRAHDGWRLAPDYLGQMQWNAGTLARIEREKFYRSCSQHWLDAMIDVELGLNQP